MKAFFHVFSFSFTQHCRGKAYQNSSRAGLFLCFFLPLLILVLSAALGGGEEPIQSPQAVFVVDGVSPLSNYSRLNEQGDPNYDGIVYHQYPEGDLEGVARILREQGEKALLLHVTRAEGRYGLELYRPSEGELSIEDASRYLDFLRENFPRLLLEAEGIEPQSLALPLELMLLPAAGIEEESPADPYEGIREVLSFVLPYVNIMLLYFMILFYGQGVANSVILEKSSKLMDSFLLHVDPRAMVLGKVLAMAAAAILQLLLWLLALVLGFILGGFVVEELMGKSLSILDFLHSLGAMELFGLFRPAGILLSLLFFAGGFLLYCALSAVGGSLAAKQEDLSSTNLLFTLALVASFFCCLSGGILGNGEGATWLCYFPFTAILIAPSRLLLGMLSPLSGLLSLGIVLLTVLLLGLLAGKVYTLMAFYRGDPPKPKELLRMLKKD